jgi:phosphatidate cytidylyltransferase
MLKTRVITAVLLLAVLLPILFMPQLAPLFPLVVLAFFGAASWEAYRLVEPQARFPLLLPAVWTLGFAGAIVGAPLGFHPEWWWSGAVAAWLLAFLPCFARGLPALGTAGARLHGVLYLLALVAAFMGMTVLYAGIPDRHPGSPILLLSAMAIVWIADIGAYFSGKAFGKRKLALSISPGKSWEGAIGGGLAVLLIGAATVLLAERAPWLRETLAVRVQAAWGWGGTMLVLVLLVAASVIGDLAESQLKRRAGMKDSSELLPGHGGVLDRIDALIPVLPLAALIGSRL